MIGLVDKVWIRYRANATHQGRGWGFEATNRRVEFEGATILYINSKGKVYDQWGANLTKYLLLIMFPFLPLCLSADPIIRQIRP